ncbi:hypothetical protein [Actinokineospora diospyrosa]|nr:hypothetical protein [Actinokineospora diospyrosa]
MRVLPEVSTGPAGTILIVACAVTLIGLALLPTTKRQPTGHSEAPLL